VRDHIQKSDGISAEDINLYFNKMSSIVETISGFPVIFPYVFVNGSMLDKEEIKENLKVLIDQIDYKLKPENKEKK
jgi:hypothetical protein